MADDLDDDVEEEEGEPEDLEVLEDDDVLVDADEVFVDDDFTDDDTDDDDDDEGTDAVEVVDPKPTVVPAKGGKAKSTAAGDDEEGADDDDDEPDPDDVEADLDTILKDRLVVAEDDEDDEEEEAPEPEDRGEGGKVRPRAPGEFVCRSCFLVKHPSQLADQALLLCRDCV